MSRLRSLRAKKFEVPNQEAAQKAAFLVPKRQLQGLPQGPQ